MRWALRRVWVGAEEISEHSWCKWTFLCAGTLCRIIAFKLVSSQGEDILCEGIKFWLRTGAMTSQRPAFKSWLHQVPTLWSRVISFISLCFIFESVTWED